MIKNYKVGDIIYCVDPKCSGYGLIVSIIDKITNKVIGKATLLPDGKLNVEIGGDK